MSIEITVKRFHFGCMSDLKLTDASVQVKKSTCDLKYTHAVRGAEHNRPQDRADGPKVRL